MTMDNLARVYSKSKLKSHMLEIMRELEANQEEAIITDHGVPVLRIVPIQKTVSVDEVFSKYRGPGKFQLFEPPDTPTIEEWELA